MKEKSVKGDFYVELIAEANKWVSYHVRKFSVSLNIRLKIEFTDLSQMYHHDHSTIWLKDITLNFPNILAPSNIDPWWLNPLNYLFS